MKEYLNVKLEEEEFGYLIINKASLNEISIVNNDEEWFGLYVKQKHQVEGHIVNKSLSKLGDFSWDQWDENFIYTAQKRCTK